MTPGVIHTDGPLVVSPTEDGPPMEEADQGEEKEFIRLQGQWEKQMRHISPKRRHLKVEVLLLYWNKVSASYLNTNKEVWRIMDGMYGIG